MIDLKNEDIKLSCFDMNDAYNIGPIKEDIVYLTNTFNENDKGSNDIESDDEKSDDKESDNNDEDPPVTALDDSTEVDLEVTNDNVWDLNLCLIAVANVIADTSLPAGAHILELEDIWNADMYSSHKSCHLTYRRQTKALSDKCQDMWIFGRSNQT